jgi:predicted neutral ceramidase superfamily lipid hydrolase
MVMVTAAVALAIPFFSVMTGLTGVFGSNLLGFLLPPSIYIKLKYSKGHWGKIKLGKLMRFKKKTWGLLAELVICSLISLFGIAMLVLGIQARLHSSVFAIAFIFLFRFSFFSVLCHLFIARDFLCRRLCVRSLTSTPAVPCSTIDVGVRLWCCFFFFCSSTESLPARTLTHLFYI